MMKTSLPEVRSYPSQNNLKQENYDLMKAHITALLSMYFIR
jgi:hypothetical protein